MSVQASPSSRNFPARQVPNPSLSDFFPAPHDHARNPQLYLSEGLLQPAISFIDIHSLKSWRLANAIRLFPSYGRLLCPIARHHTDRVNGHTNPDKLGRSFYLHMS